VPLDTHVVGIDLNDDLHDGALCPVGGDGAPGKLAADGKAGVTREHAAAHAACDCGARPVHRSLTMKTVLAFERAAVQATHQEGIIWLCAAPAPAQRCPQYQVCSRLDTAVSHIFVEIRWSLSARARRQLAQLDCNSLTD